MDGSALSLAEREFLAALHDLGVRFLMVGMSAALVEGANGATQDIDLWFERPDARIEAAARKAGGFWISGFGMQPPSLGGDPLDRFDVVFSLDGLRAFAEEYADAKEHVVDGVPIRVLPLARVVASKRAANRLKDRTQLPALEEALAVLESSGEKDGDPA